MLFDATDFYGLVLTLDAKDEADAARQLCEYYRVTELTRLAVRPHVDGEFRPAQCEHKKIVVTPIVTVTYEVKEMERW